MTRTAWRVATVLTPFVVAVMLPIWTVQILNRRPRD